MKNKTKTILLSIGFLAAVTTTTLIFLPEILNNNSNNNNNNNNNNNQNGNNNKKPSKKPNVSQKQGNTSKKPSGNGSGIRASGEHTFKMGHWNIQNYTGNDDKQADKKKRIALLADKEKFDVLGLTEVKNGNGIKSLVEEMNKLNNSNLYAYTISEKLSATFNKTKGQAEYVAIIYNKNKFEPVKFNNGKVDYSYIDKFKDFLGNQNAEYVRPPYGVKFKYKPLPDKHMTFVFDHFDSPGSRTEGKQNISPKTKDRIGVFEYREAKQLFNVLEHFDKIGDNKGNIFFGGDTNIQLGKEPLAFDWLKKYSKSGKYESVFDDSDEYKTSLNRKGGYSQPYDKIFYKSNFRLINKEVFDIYKVVTDPVYKALLEKHGVGITNKNEISNGSVLSDHTYVTATFKIE